MPGFAEWQTLRHKWATGGWPPMSHACLNCGITRAEWESAKTAQAPRRMYPCPVERPQAGWMGRQGFTMTDHAWPQGARGSALRCLHCGQTPTEASSSEHAPTYTPNPDRWQSVTRLLSSAG